MTSLAPTAPFALSRHDRRADARAVTGPPLAPLSPPVLISDCATPLAGETILSLILRRLAERD